MGVILLLRHGQASWGAADYDQLSTRGEAQSVQLGRSLVDRGVEPTTLVTGRMTRHQQTARAAADAAGWSTELVTDAGWDEFDHVQVLQVHGPPDGSVPEQLSRQEFQRWFAAATRRWTAGNHDGEYDETFGDFSARVQAALRRTAETLGAGETAVVFTSGGPVSWVAASLLGGDAQLWMRLNPVTVNAAVTKVVVGARGTTLVSFNDHGHLEPSQVTYR